MTGDDILAGKAGFQKADLMDYGSLYGMGSYFGQDYTAWALCGSPISPRTGWPGRVRQAVRPTGQRAAGVGEDDDARACSASI